MTTSIKSLSRAEILKLAESQGLPSFRAKQLLEWLYKKNASSYSDMTNLPKALRESLAQEYLLARPRVIDQQRSSDGTRKFLLGYEGGYTAETVGIPSDDGRLTVCCSSQAGCAMGCDFCATGKTGFRANLEIGEIVDQVLLVQDEFGKRVSNIVVMGQGEPFLNFDNVIEALRICNDNALLGIGARKITISTCGIIPGIKKFAEVDEQFTLAVSLHSAIQETRNQLMPGVAKYPLAALKEELAAYIARAKRRVTFEYALIRGVNDSPKHLGELMNFCDGLLCHVNLIPLNHIEGSNYQPSSPNVLAAWEQNLNDAGFETSVRHSRGADIAGACGQLANSVRANS